MHWKTDAARSYKQNVSPDAKICREPLAWQENWDAVASLMEITHQLTVPVGHEIFGNATRLRLETKCKHSDGGAEHHEKSSPPSGECLLNHSAFLLEGIILPESTRTNVDRRRPLGQPAHQLKVIFEPPTVVHPTRPSNARVSAPREATSPPFRNACGHAIMESMVPSCLSRWRCFLKLIDRETRLSYSMSYEVTYPGESPLLKRDWRNLMLISITPPRQRGARTLTSRYFILTSAQACPVSQHRKQPWHPR